MKVDSMDSNIVVLIRLNVCIMNILNLNMESKKIKICRSGIKFSFSHIVFVASTVFAMFYGVNLASALSVEGKVQFVCIVFLLAKLTMRSTISEDNNKKEITAGTSRNQSKDVSLSPRNVLRMIVSQLRKVIRTLAEQIATSTKATITTELIVRDESRRRVKRTDRGWRNG